MRRGRARGAPSSSRAGARRPKARNSYAPRLGSGPLEDLERGHPGEEGVDGVLRALRDLDELRDRPRAVDVREELRLPALELDLVQAVRRLLRWRESILGREQPEEPLRLVELLHAARDEVRRVQVDLDRLGRGAVGEVEAVLALLPA